MYEFKVSIVVLSYNAVTTIEQTLNSVLRQRVDLKLIDLVISDDSSSDGTPDLVNKWIAENCSVFGRVIFISSEQNMGVSANCNKAWKASLGTWIKTIAADDLLLDNCIIDNLNYTYANPGTLAVFSRCRGFKDNNHFNSFPMTVDRGFFDVPANDQYKQLLVDCYPLAPTSFIHIDAFELASYADERFPMMEDYPLWLKMTKLGIKLHFLDAETILYRLGNSLSVGSERIANLAYINSLYDFQRMCIWPQLGWLHIFRKLDDSIIYLDKYLGIKLFGNRVSKTYKLFKFMTFFLRPYRAFKVCALFLRRLR